MESGVIQRIPIGLKNLQPSYLLTGWKKENSLSHLRTICPILLQQQYASTVRTKKHLLHTKKGRKQEIKTHSPLLWTKALGTAIMDQIFLSIDREKATIHPISREEQSKSTCPESSNTISAISTLFSSRKTIKAWRLRALYRCHTALLRQHSTKTIKHTQRQMQISCPQASTLFM